MKKTRKIAAMIAAMALTAAMCVPTAMMSASAATPVSVDTSTDNASHTYSAYQIFTGTYDATLGLTITDYGAGYNGTGLAGDTDFRALVITPADNSDPSNPVAAVTVGDFLGTKTDAASVA